MLLDRDGAEDIDFFLSAYARSISSGLITLAGMAIPAMGIVLMTGLETPVFVGETYWAWAGVAYWAY